VCIGAPFRRISALRRADRVLDEWITRFDAHEDEVAARFGEEFVRMWRWSRCGTAVADPYVAKRLV